jgi:hypothetical protein
MPSAPGLNASAKKHRKSSSGLKRSSPGPKASRKKQTESAGGPKPSGRGLIESTAGPVEFSGERLVSGTGPNVSSRRRNESAVSPSEFGRRANKLVDDSNRSPPPGFFLRALCASAVNRSSDSWVPAFLIRFSSGFRLPTSASKLPSFQHFSISAFQHFAYGLSGSRKIPDLPD